MNDNQIHTGADNLTHQAMEEALHRRNTAEIRRLLEAGFLLSNAPRTPDGYRAASLLPQRANSTITASTPITKN